jgi:hypothetical protein
MTATALGTRAWINGGFANAVPSRIFASYNQEA